MGLGYVILRYSAIAHFPTMSCTLHTLPYTSIPCIIITINNILGTVVQSVVSLTSSLRVISLTVLEDSIYNILIFFAEKMWVAFALQKLLTFFSKKFQHICVSLDVNFNDTLTNDIVSFQQLGPGLRKIYGTCTGSQLPVFSVKSPGAFYSAHINKILGGILVSLVFRTHSKNASKSYRPA